MSFRLPDSNLECSGWIDEDKRILSQSLSIKDKAYYLEKRFQKIFWGPMDSVFLRSAPQHGSVNSREMSFFVIGTTVLCGAIEAIGAFLIGGGNSNNETRFRATIRTLMRAWNRTTTKGTSVPYWMWKHLRNPLAHSFSIGSGGMGYLKTRRYKEPARGKIIIHIEVLYKEFRVAYEKYLRILRSGKPGIIIRNFEIRFFEVFVKSQV